MTWHKIYCNPLTSCLLDAFCKQKTRRTAVHTYLRHVCSSKCVPGLAWLCLPKKLKNCAHMHACTPRRRTSRTCSMIAQQVSSCSALGEIGRIIIIRCAACSSIRSACAAARTTRLYFAAQPTGSWNAKRQNFGKGTLSFEPLSFSTQKWYRSKDLVT